MKTKKVAFLMLALLMVWAALPMQRAAGAEPEFNVSDIAVINNIIAVNGWGVPRAPDDGSSVPGEWTGKVTWTTDATNRRVVMLDISYTGLIGTLDVSGLTALQYLQCRYNQLTGLNVSGLSALQSLYCENNQLTGLALDQGAPYQYINVTYNYMADTGAVTGRTINWDEVNYRFAPQYRRVSYDANGGSGQMQADKVVDGEAFWLPENGFKAPADNKYFRAWAIGDVNGPQKQGWEQHTFYADTTLYAIWYSVATGVSLNKTMATLTVGGSETLTATVEPPDAVNKTVTWSSDKPAVATVDQNGKVTAVAPGTATITVSTAGGLYTATCTVTVVAPVTGVSLNKTTTTLTVGGSETLTATVAPENAANKAVTWSSDKPAVATVDNGGKVTAKAPGTAAITVKTADGGKTATCTVTVVAPVTGVTLNKTTVTLTVGGVETLTATVAPENAANKAVTWSSDKPAVAAVDNGGKVTAKAPGTAAITVKTADGGKTATCTVTVVAPVTGVSLKKTATTLTVGGAETLTATVAPPDATNKAVTWSSDKPAVATVDAAGKVTAKAPGTAAITVKTADGGKTATCTVTVVAPVTGVTLNKTTVTLTVGGSETLTATVAPPNATNKAVTWSSDKPAVATVDQSGKVIAVTPGTATITVTTADGGKTASCSITVQPAAAPFAGTVTFDKGAAQVGEPITITWDLPEGASQCSVHAYYWYVKEEGSDARILAESGGGADMSSISFTPTKGKELMLELYLQDDENKIYSYQSDWISIGGDDPVPPASKGDANNDGAVDILDLVSIIEYIVNGAEPISKEGADANGDGTVDILDLVWIIEMIVKE